MFPVPSLLKLGIPPLTYSVAPQNVQDLGTGIRRAGYRFGADGNVYTFKSTTGWVQAGTWISDPSYLDGLHEVRITSVVWAEGSSFFTASAAENAWFTLSGDATWEVRDAISSAAGNADVTFTVELRYNGGATITSGSITLAAIWDIS